MFCIQLTEEERSAIINKSSTYDENEVCICKRKRDDLFLLLIKDDQSSIRPRIESKIGRPSTKSSSDNEQTNRNDNSNYDSLVGSLKSDTIYWKDQQSTVNKYFSL